MLWPSFARLGEKAPMLRAGDIQSINQSIAKDATFCCYSHRLLPRGVAMGGGPPPTSVVSPIFCAVKLTKFRPAIRAFSIFRAFSCPQMRLRLLCGASVHHFPRLPSCICEGARCPEPSQSPRSPITPRVHPLPLIFGPLGLSRSVPPNAYGCRSKSTFVRPENCRIPRN